MRKILTILFFIIGLQAFSQTYVPNQSLYNWTRGAEFSDDVILSSLASGTDTIFLVVNSATGTIDTIGITELRTIFGGGGDTPTLQEVTSEGATTTNDVVFEGNFEAGKLTQTSGIHSFAQGSGTRADANYSHAEGRGARTRAFYSHAEGLDTETLGQGSHAEGDRSEASGKAAHAEGKQCFSTGDFSHAEGELTTANGKISHTEGYRTVANSYAEKAQGLWNLEPTANSATSFHPLDNLWSIGNGSGFLDRNNALTMLKNGTTTIDTTWSYGSKMTGSTFSGLQIPHTEYVNKNIITSGTTANRPSSPATGELYFDTTISPARVIIYNGTAWVNVDGTAL